MHEKSETQAGNIFLQLNGHFQHTNQVAWSPDGRYTATNTSRACIVQVWEALTGVLVATHTLSSASYVVALAWSPDSTALASGCGNTVEVWEALSGRTFTYLDGFFARRSVRALAWSPNGRYLAFGAHARSVLVKKIATGKTVSAYKRCEGDVPALTWSPDGNYLAFAGGGNAIVVRRMQPWRRTILTYRGHSAHVWTVAWSPDGNYIALGSWDKCVYIVDATTGEPLFIFRSHSGLVRKIVWMADSKRVVSASNEVLLWQAVSDAFLPGRKRDEKNAGKSRSQ